MLDTGTPTRNQAGLLAGDRPRVSLFGAAPDTGNLGVSALCESLLGGLWARRADVHVSVFDHGRGERAWSPAGMPDSAAVIRCGAVCSRRLYRSESHWRMWASASWGLGVNRGVERVRMSDAVLDVSGGDSFSDLYGVKRFRAVTMPKRLALALGRPLVLLPQTYGPFETADARRQAEEIVRAADRAWARDARSFEVLQELLGDRYDPARHGCAVDMAFGLTAREPDQPLPGPIAGWFADRSTPIVGINVSGLIANRASAARFGLRADYREIVSRLTCEILASSDVRVVLVPHVHAPIGHPESDLEASLEIARRAPRAAQSRVCVLPTGMSASETKWAIGRLDWLCATRMHACIAGLSSGVPVCGIAYSDKALGVFESCAMGGELVDPRSVGTEDALDAALDSFRRRDETRARLRVGLSPALDLNATFFDDLSRTLGLTGAADRSGVAA
ncbi:MAG: polysaccharide pyruvyl transferase family protein [Phycisphaerales bacterium]